MAAPIIFAMMVGVEGFIAPGYSQVTQPISDLGAYSLYGSTALLQNVNFWVFGVLVVIFAFGLRRTVPGVGKVPVALGIFGTMVFVAGLFPDQPVPYPGGVHALVSFVAFFSIIISQFVAWRRFGRKELGRGWAYYSNYSLASGVISVALLIVFASLQGSPYLGVAQRLFLAVPWIWVGALALKVWRGQLSLGRSTASGRQWTSWVANVYLRAHWSKFVAALVLELFGVSLSSMPWHLTWVGLRTPLISRSDKFAQTC